MTLSRFRRIQFGLYRVFEPRAVLEWQSFFVFKPLLKKLKSGDGHPVIVFPGFVSSDRATRPLRGLLKDLGYDAHGWGLGTNLLFDETLEAEMVALVNEVHEKTGRKVSLVGWSLGGLYAREVAKACPGKVRSVVTLGSPISGNMRHSNAHTLYKAINGKPSKVDLTRYSSLNTPPNVPTTSIYSKTDGIVAWEGSVQKRGEFTENIELPASHLGIGVNPLTMYVLADRLAQPEGQWARFDIKGLRRLLYKRPSPRVQSALFSSES